MSSHHQPKLTMSISTLFDPQMGSDDAAEWVSFVLPKYKRNAQLNGMQFQSNAFWQHSYKLSNPSKEVGKLKENKEKDIYNYSQITSYGILGTRNRVGCPKNKLSSTYNIRTNSCMLRKNIDLEAQKQSLDKALFASKEANEYIPQSTMRKVLLSDESDKLGATSKLKDNCYNNFSKCNKQYFTRNTSTFDTLEKDFDKVISNWKIQSSNHAQKSSFDLFESIESCDENSRNVHVSKGLLRCRRYQNEVEEEINESRSYRVIFEDITYDYLEPRIVTVNKEKSTINTNNDKSSESKIPSVNSFPPGVCALRRNTDLETPRDISRSEACFMIGTINKGLLSLNEADEYLPPFKKKKMSLAEGSVKSSVSLVHDYNFWKHNNQYFTQNNLHSMHYLRRSQRLKDEQKSSSKKYNSNNYDPNWRNIFNAKKKTIFIPVGFITKHKLADFKEHRSKRNYTQTLLWNHTYNLRHLDERLLRYAIKLEKDE